MTVLVRPVHAADGFVGEDDAYVDRLRDVATRAREAEVYVAALPERPGVLAGTVTFCPQGSPWCELARRR